MSFLETSPFGITRRHFFSRTARGLGALALSSLLPRQLLAEDPAAAGGLPGFPNFAPKAKRVIYLFQSGAPSQMDLFDYKPLLNQRNGEQLPERVRGGQTLTAMSAQQASIPLAGSLFKFQQHGQSGAWFSDLLPHTASIADELCIIRSMYTEAFNHDPAITFFQTGSQIAGRPSMGSWVHYGLGSMNQNLPAFVVLVTPNKHDQPLYPRLWSSGFLDSRFQGIQFRAGKEPILYLSNPDGPCGTGRRALLDKLSALNRHQFERELDPEIESRIAQYELAYHMQSTAPEATDLSGEKDSTFELYGPDSRKPGTYAANCLLARRLAERGVRFIQLYHQGWDQHDNLPSGITVQARETDQASAALITDLKQRGMLDDTLVIWGGEFGRTCYSQGKLTKDNYGRDHHPRCFTVWMAGGGVKQGLTYGQTDEYGYNIVDADGAVLHPEKSKLTPGAVHVHDLQATILHLLGIDHEQLNYLYQGRRFRLTDVHGHVVQEVLA
ncbi:conserved exported hypothetical protein [Verrucomicrobia bacterium]|nr:conserved exported hypothetical protein [Verrucomicrobiota bacterium]